MHFYFAIAAKSSGLKMKSMSMMNFFFNMGEGGWVSKHFKVLTVSKDNS